MMMVWFGLADIQTKLAGLGLADSMQEGEEENRTVSNRYKDDQVHYSYFL